MLKRRLSTPRAATVIVLAAAVAVSVTVVPSLAQSFLTKQAASKVFVTNKAAKQTYVSFATKTSAAKTIITFSGPASCTTAKAPTPDQACPVQILVDGQSTGKVNFAPATIEGSSTKPAATVIHTIVQTTVLGKGGHTVAVQYAGASNVTFALKSWNLAVTAYPEPEEELSFPGEEKEKTGGSGGTTPGGGGWVGAAPGPGRGSASPSTRRAR